MSVLLFDSFFFNVKHSLHLGMDEHTQCKGGREHNGFI